mmetsp:Transcript_84153/g.168516  ORF Transcript_84153/g.168516 Transcript_84153/m.168516 type:complete len:84 (+) Transcript_84153:277-528(+)
MTNSMREFKDDVEVSNPPPVLLLSIPEIISLCCCWLVHSVIINAHAFSKLFVPPTAVKFITFLREPIARALSEYNHVTEGDGV